LSNNTETINNNIIYKHSIKLEKASNGYRVNVHVYGNNIKETVKEIFDLLAEVKKVATEQNIILVPYDGPETQKTINTNTKKEND